MIDFSSFAVHTLNETDFPPGASAGSGLAVTYASGSPTVATIVNGNIHLIGTGTALITPTRVH